MHSAIITAQGTWFRDLPGVEDDKADICLGQCIRNGRDGLWIRRTVAGLGSDFGFLGRVLGGVLAAGGSRRVNELVLFYATNAPFDQLILVGTSRGCGIILRVAWQIYQLGAKRIDLLVLFDPVFGSWRTGQPWYRWEKQMPPIVRTGITVRAMSETRFCFPGAELEDRTTYWVEGDHSDVCSGAGASMFPALEAVGLYRRSGTLPVVDPSRITMAQRRRLAEPYHHFWPMPATAS